MSGRNSEIKKTKTRKHKVRAVSVALGNPKGIVALMDVYIHT